jgi:hypothetical protein
MKKILLTINHVYLLFGATLYVGVLWAMKFFWFPTWHKLTTANYYDQFVPQTTAATKFFTVVVPLMFLASLIMIVSEWKTKLRWIAIAILLTLGAATFIGTTKIIPINKIMAQGVTDQTQLTELMTKWIALNEFRFYSLTFLWLLVVFYFVTKGNLPQAIEENKS